ncbi:hypothetical protein IJ847_02575 [Candidatus Saccharibacteria bacterium]|nr:hypothetical protein [Candidatus Saccharibacteria bacterium]
MKKKTLAFIAILLASTLIIAPVAALSIDTIISGETINKEDVESIENGEKYCLAHSEIAENKLVVTYYERTEEGCEFSSATETQTAEIVILENNPELTEKYTELTTEEEPAVVVEDLDLISAMTDETVELAELPNYNHEVAAVNEENDSELELDARAGDLEDPFKQEFAGNALVSQNGIYQGIIKDFTFNLQHVIYIPESTDESVDAYAQAAQERAQNIVAEANVQHAGKIADICTILELGEDCEIESELAKELNTEDFYFVTIEKENGVTDIVLIVKNDEKVSEYDTAYGLGGKGETEETPAEETVEKSVVVATASSEDANFEEPASEPQSVTVATTSTPSTVYYGNSSYTTKQPEKTETKTEEPVKTEAKEEEKEEASEEEEKQSNPLPIIIIGIVVVAGIALFLTRKKSGKKYSN